MCKLLSLTNISKLSTSDLDKLTLIAASELGKTERCGFGVTVQNADLTLYARRFLDPAKVSLSGPLSNLPFIKDNGNEEGILTDSYKAVVFHGRTSTNDRNLLNTHPIVKHDMWLSHNGVVEDSGPKYKMQTTNDTEHLVERLSKGITAVEKHISGYYATIHFELLKPELFILKDSIAQLHAARIIELDSFIFATTSELIKKIASSMQWTFSDLGEVEDNIYLEIDGTSVMTMEPITPKGRSEYSDRLASRSLGFSLYDNDTQSTDGYAIEDHLYEVEDLSDSSWTFIHRDREITREKYLKLDETEKVDCIVIREDGTICSPDREIDGTFFETKYPYAK